MNMAGLLSLKLFPFYTTIKMPSSVTIRRDKNEYDMASYHLVFNFDDPKD